MQAVLLYYKYITLQDDRAAVAQWYQNNCGDLQLRGRVRVAHDGVNVTVCIPCALGKHLAAIYHHEPHEAAQLCTVS